jgi:membrane protein DedA with SNARE-associated domain
MDTLIQLLSSHQLPVVAIYAGAFLFGETILIAASFMAAQGVWTLWSVFWLGLAGTLTADSLWFLLGQSILVRHTHLNDCVLVESATAIQKIFCL